MKKILWLLLLFLLPFQSTNLYAALVNGLTLTIDEGSYWGLEIGNRVFLPTFITCESHLILGAEQAGSINHYGVPDGTEISNIDLPSEFYGYSTLHQTTSPVNVLSSS